jgi:AraC-like DNA-binding protein/mannose-6-phosphate isomerase-like protein (cupin superfamily)
MKKGQDIFIELQGLKIIHHKVPGKELGSHSHAEHEFFFPIHGEITIGYEGREYTAGPGKMLYVPPHIEHSFRSSAVGVGERLIWLVTDSAWKKHSEKTNYPITVFPINSLAKELLFYLLLKRDVNGEKYFISALIETLIDSLDSTQMSQHMELTHLMGKIKDERVVKSLKLLDSKLGVDALTSVAEDSGMSLRNFNRLFLKETAMTPKEYVQMKRMEKARFLLTSTKLSITDISLEVGYGSVSKFIEAFKKLEGKLPSDFRNDSAGGV